MEFAFLLVTDIINTSYRRDYMTDNPDPEGDSDTSDSIDEMLQHLPGAKERAKKRRATSASNKNWSKKAKLMRQRPDPAVLASNYKSRLEELVELPKVTHRAGKKWSSAKAGLEAHGRMPIYYRLDGEVTYTGYITQMVIHPEDESDVPQVIQDHITEDDTYADYNDKYDVTTFLVTEGKRLDEPFPQSELEQIEGGEFVDEDFSYQPAYVRQRDGDFPDF